MFGRPAAVCQCGDGGTELGTRGVMSVTSSVSGDVSERHHVTGLPPRAVPLFVCSAPVELFVQAVRHQRRCDRSGCAVPNGVFDCDRVRALPSCLNVSEPLQSSFSSAFILLAVIVAIARLIDRRCLKAVYG